MNYGDYAYIEAFPRGMFRIFPDPQHRPARAALRGLDPAGGAGERAHGAPHRAPRAATSSIANGLSEEDFETTRDYLMKNVYVMTATQDQQLGYALDSEWYGIPEFTAYMRDKLRRSRAPT